MTAPAFVRSLAARARRRVTLAAVAGLGLLAALETAVALVAPYRAPRPQDWQAAAAWVKAEHQDRDLMVAAPAWADPVLRQHLGDLLPPQIAARMDHQSYARVWELSQRGAKAPETAGAHLRKERTFGNLRVRLYDRDELPLIYDFLDNWAHARVFRVESGGKVVPCQAQPGQHQCPDIGWNFVKRQLLEIGNSLRLGLYAQPVKNATLAIEYPDIPLGRELAVGAGLHNVWLRKAGTGTVWMRVLVGGQEVGRFESTNRTGWKVMRMPTPAFAGKSGTVRFEITSEEPFARHFGFAAEARGL